MNKKIIALMIIFAVYAVIAFADTPVDFTVSPASLRFNWTAPALNITIGLNTSLGDDYNATIIVNNTTGFTDSLGRGLAIIVYNTNTSENTTTFLLNYSSLNSTKATLYPNMSAPAGRYTGKIYVYNASTPTNNTSIDVLVDIPVSVPSGQFSGNATNSSTNIFFFNASENSAMLYVNFTDVRGGDLFVVLKDSNGTQKAIINTTQQNLTYSFIRSNTDFGGDNKYWSLEITGENGTTPVTYNATLTIIPINFKVNNTLERATASFIKNLNQAKNFTFSFNISNPSSANVTVNNITTSIIVGTSSNNFTITSDAIPPFNLTPGQNYQVNVSLNSTVYNHPKGKYYGWIFINTSDGYPNKTFNLSLEIEVTDQLNVTVKGFWKNEAPGTWPMPSDIINITLDVKYMDGSSPSYSGTSEYNISASLSHLNNNAYTRTCNISKENVADYYSKCTIPNTTAGGNYTLTVQFNDKNSNVGTGTANVILNQTGIVLEISSGSIGGNVNEIFPVDLTVKNVGYLNASKIIISRTIGSCAEIYSVNDSYINSNGFDLEQGKELTIKNAWKIKLKTAGDCVFTAYGSSINGSSSFNYLFVKNSSIAINVNSGGENESGGGSSGGSLIGLAFSEYPRNITIKAGETYNAVLRVRSTGNLSTLGVKVWVLGIPASWWSQPPAQDITFGGIATFIVPISVPADASPGQYIISFIANRTGASAREDSVLYVLAAGTNKTSNATSEELSSNLTNLTAFYESLTELLDQVKKKGENVSSIEEILNETGEMISKANAYLTLNNTSAAESLISEISTRLSSIGSQLNEIKSKIEAREMGLLTNILIGGLIVVGVIVLIYMLMPLKSGYIPGVGYRHAKHKTRLHELIAKIKERRARGGKY